VELTFAPEGAGTRLVLTQRGFPDAATRDDFAGGWGGVWDGLTPGEHETGPAG
jgi:Activator of Hsp90 ATPase homolog 1-like protein